MGYSRLVDLRKRLKNARHRAAYWSGRPSARGFGYCPYSGADADIEYEMALDDCHAIADEIERITGKRPIVTDYRDRFRERFLSCKIP